jgi:hypothetical protein
VFYGKRAGSPRTVESQEKKKRNEKIKNEKENQINKTLRKCGQQ